MAGDAEAICAKALRRLDPALEILHEISHGNVEACALKTERLHFGKHRILVSREPRKTREFNALVPKLREMGIIINDLYTPLATDLYKYIGADTIHLSEDGIALCADMVSEVILREAEKLPEKNRRENIENITGLGAPV